MRMHVYGGGVTEVFKRTSRKRSWIGNQIYLGDHTFNGIGREIKKVFKNIKIDRENAHACGSAFHLTLYFKSNADEAEFMLKQKDTTLNLEKR